MVVFLLMVNSLLHRQLICARVNEHYYKGTTISASTLHKLLSQIYILNCISTTANLATSFICFNIIILFVLVA